MAEHDKPSKAEDEYFARQEFERKKQWAAENMKNMAVEEKEAAKKAHWMKCPKCGMDLHTIDFQGVKVDRCPSCGGTFFDAGEIEEVLKRGSGFLSKVQSIFS
jgi:acetyl-CoA carboxylase beta subunit